MIRTAMDGIERYSCLRFVVRTTENDYLDFQDTPTGCNSYVGRTGGGQRVSIMTNNADPTKGHCVHNGVIQHEILHAAGFEHMQSSVDRDQYVKINYANIQVVDGQNMSFAFDIYPSQRNDTSYDLNSVMHYEPYAFSIQYGVLPTIEPIDKSIPLSKLGQRVGLSTGDFLRLSRLYKCWR